MKRVFIFISTILFSCYLVTMIVQQNQQISFSSYNAVDVTGQALTDHKVSNRKEVTDALTNLANEHNSLIARRIVQPNEKGEIDFRYQFYGHVSPPSNLKRASQESAEGSDIVSNYLIVSGDLKGAELISTFSQLGYNAVDFSSYIANGVKITDYVPNGNTIYVSPNYLEKQNVGVSDEFLAQMKKLKRGEFGLIIPEKLKNSRKELESIYSEYMSGFSSRSLNPHSHHLFKVSVSTEFVKDKKKRFLYNTDSDIPMQFLNDPIIVVTTPEAMGDTPSSQLFWGTEVGSGLHMTGYKDSIDLLKQGGVYQWVSYLTNNRNSYYKILSESRSRLAFLLIGVLLGLLTSILLFDSMNLLYFEQFRKEIFIKRLSGMRFEEVHFNYLFSQICVLGVALVFLIFLTHHLIMSLLIVSLFIINMFTILYRQTLTESRTSVSVLKGK